MLTELIFWNMSKDDATNIMHNSNSLLESRLILAIIFSTFLFISLYTHSC